MTHGASLAYLKKSSTVTFTLSTLRAVTLTIISQRLHNLCVPRISFPLYITYYQIQQIQCIRWHIILKPLLTPMCPPLPWFRFLNIMFHYF